MKTLEASGLVHGGHPCIHLSLQQSLKTYRYNVINVLSFVRTVPHSQFKDAVKSC